MLLTITSSGARPPISATCCTRTRRGCSRSTLAFGQAHVFYPEATDGALHRGAAARRRPGRAGARPRRRGDGARSAQYVNDRPYVASSFLSVAIAQVFGTALAGRSEERPELADAAAPARGAARRSLPCRGGEAFLRRLFEPLGYEVDGRAAPARRARSRSGATSRYFDVDARRHDAALARPARAPLRAASRCSTTTSTTGSATTRSRSCCATARAGCGASRARADRPPLPASTSARLTRDGARPAARGRRRPTRTPTQRAARRRGGGGRGAAAA